MGTRGFYGLPTRFNRSTPLLVVGHFSYLCRNLKPHLYQYINVVTNLKNTPRCHWVYIRTHTPHVAHTPIGIPSVYTKVCQPSLSASEYLL